MVNNLLLSESQQTISGSGSQPGSRSMLRKSELRDVVSAMLCRVKCLTQVNGFIHSAVSRLVFIYRYVVGMSTLLSSKPVLVHGEIYFNW